MNRIIRLALAGLGGLALAGGCASGPRSVSAVFPEAAAALSRPQAGLLLDTIRLLILIEDYAAAFQARDETGFINCFSPRFSYYENTIAWFRQRVREEYFQRFDSLGLAVEEIEIVIYRDTPSFWLRQEDYDWLAGAGGERVLRARYPVRIEGGSRPIEIELDPAPDRVRPDPRGAKGAPRPASIPVRVTAGYDPLIEGPMAEAKLRVRLTCAAASTAVETSEVQILLLENHGGDWRIVSLR